MATNSGPLWKQPKKKRKRNSLRSRSTPIDPLWIQTREEWFEFNPPDLGEEYYQCALCPFPVHISEVVLDHIQTRSSRPDLRYDFNNLQPAHFKCNGLRGSMSIEAWHNKTSP